MEKKIQQYDLFNNPMVESAKKSMTPEQREYYESIGKHMYTNEKIKLMESGSKVQESTEESKLAYAYMSVKSGLHPDDLTDEELRLLAKYYGKTWYTKFDYKDGDVRKPAVEFVTEQDGIIDSKNLVKQFNKSRQQIRYDKRKNEKAMKKINKKQGK